MDCSYSAGGELYLLNGCTTTVAGDANAIFDRALSSSRNRDAEHDRHVRRICRAVLDGRDEGRDRELPGRIARTRFACADGCGIHFYSDAGFETATASAAEIGARVC